MKYRTIASLFLLAFTASLALAQVDPLTGTVTNDATMARLRLAYTIHRGPNVDWFVDGAVAVNGGQPQIDIPAGYINGYLFLAPGTYSVTVVPTGKTVAEALLGPLDVAVAAGHRYTLVVMGQLEDATHDSLLIDETAELQKIPQAVDQEIVFVVNNLAGATTFRVDQDGVGPGDVAPGSFVVAPLLAGPRLDIAVMADRRNIKEFVWGYGRSVDRLLSFTGHYPGSMGRDFDYYESFPSSALNTLELLRTLSDSGAAFTHLVTFDTFLAAVELAGLTDILSEGDPLMVLPPTDAAFAALPSDQFDALMADPIALGDLLRNHIVEAYVPKGALATTPGGPFDRSFTNLLGEMITIDDGYRVNGFYVGDFGSIFAANGTQVHPITRVLLPPTP